MQPRTALNSDAFRAALDLYVADAQVDVDAAMDVGRAAAVHPWADDVLTEWFDAQPTTAQAVDVATAVLFGFERANRPAPPRVVASLVERARALSASGLGRAANNVAFVAVRALRDPEQPRELRRAARELLEDLLAHADRRSLQSVGRDAARDALARNPLP